MLTRKGVVPNGGVLLRTFGEKKNFVLYKTKVSDKWLSLKLILAAGAAVKANYVLYWNGQRLNKGHDVNILEEYQPEMLKDIIGYLKENFPTFASESDKAPRTSEGVVPESGEEIATLEDGVEWGLYLLPRTESPNLVVKLVAKDRVTGRANYTVNWNGSRFIRDEQRQRLMERPELHDKVESFLEQYESEVKVIEEVKKPEPEVTAESVYAKLEGTKRRSEEGKNLGGVGFISERERDLLVYEHTGYPGYLEVRLTADEKKVYATDPFFVVRILDNGALEAFGKLYNYLGDAQPRVEELLKQYFLEKELYGTIDSGEQAE